MEKKRYVVTSTRSASGKTAITAALALKKPSTSGYFKPIADRLEDEKHLVDRDCSLMKEILSLEAPLEMMSVVRDYPGLFRDRTREEFPDKIKERVALQEDREIMFIESGRNYSYGAYVGLDALTLSRLTDSRIILVADGDVGMLEDKTIVAHAYFTSQGADVVGVILNKVREEDLGYLDNVTTPALERRGIEILGTVPYIEDISRLTVRDIARELNAKVIGGEGGLDNVVEDIFIGAMSVTTAMKNPLFWRKRKVIITGGDRVDMQLAAFESDTSALILTGNIFPEPQVVAKADSISVPLLLVPGDTYTVSRRVERVEPHLKLDLEGRRKLLEALKENVEVEKILG
ncbi:MAG: hypothetical protein DRN40_06130 [Thermoplasmata archaeon]|nr:MAG: hypothetical protein DRN40_06130 [Thermoplasmata archaeon]